MADPDAIRTTSTREVYANEWLRLLGTREIPWRFDVIEVILTDGEKPRVHRVENAF